LKGSFIKKTERSGERSGNERERKNAGQKRAREVLSNENREEGPFQKEARSIRSYAESSMIKEESVLSKGKFAS